MHFCKIYNEYVSLKLKSGKKALSIKDFENFAFTSINNLNSFISDKSYVHDTFSDMSRPKMIERLKKTLTTGTIFTAIGDIYEQVEKEMLELRESIRTEILTEVDRKLTEIKDATTEEIRISNGHLYDKLNLNLKVAVDDKFTSFNTKMNEYKKYTIGLINNLTTKVGLNVKLDYIKVNNYYVMNMNANTGIPLRTAIVSKITKINRFRF